jgi:hypothetical protein
MQSDLCKTTFLISADFEEEKTGKEDSNQKS